MWLSDTQGGQNDQIYNNTFADINVQSNGVVFQGGSGSTGHSFINNLLYTNVSSPSFKSFLRTQVSGTPIPTIDYNSYVNASNVGAHSSWQIQGAQSFNLASWQSASSGETHSHATTDDVYGSYIGVSQSSTWINNNTDYTLTSASRMYQSGSSLSGINSAIDTNGRPIVTPNTPNIGCIQN